MEQLKPLEDVITKVHKDLPRLPKGLTTWLVENAWWLVIIGVAVGALMALTAITGLTAGSVVVGLVNGFGYGSEIFAKGIVGIVVLVLTVVVEAMAIQPLKAKQKRGWDLLFLASLIGIAGSIISALLSGPYGIVPGIIWTAILAAISFYVLFELRTYYVGSQAVKPSKEA